MKYKVLILILLIMFIPSFVYAQRGCCSYHGGVAGCSSSGRQICRDGTLSPSCTCAAIVSYVYGCTDPSAKNYNSSANRDDGSCQYYVVGCTDPEADNYNKDAEISNYSCHYSHVYGCMDSKAVNYNANANVDDSTCEYAISNYDVIGKSGNIDAFLSSASKVFGVVALICNLGIIIWYAFNYKKYNLAEIFR